MEESNLSFHVELQSEKETKINQLSSNIYVMVIIFIVASLAHLIIASYLLSMVPLISILTIRSVFMILLPLIYSKLFDHTLLNIEADCARILISSSFFLFFAWLSQYYSLQVLPMSEAATFTQLIPAQILVFSYLFIQPSNQMIFALSLIQVLLTFSFQGKFWVVVVCNAYPLIMSFLYILKQISTKEIHPITSLMYSSMLQIPVLVLLAAVLGELGTLSEMRVLIGGFALVVSQVGAQLAQQGLVELLRGDVWAIQGAVVVLAIPVQFLKGRVSVLATISEAIIIATSIKLNIK